MLLEKNRLGQKKNTIKKIEPFDPVIDAIEEQLKTESPD